MAKVTAPFFGFHASQQINKALVYFVWKGINVVRSWVVPANPNSADQQTQRNNFDAIVGNWHDPALNIADRTAWNVAASSVKYKPQSGFNRFMGRYRSFFVQTARQAFIWTYANVAHGAAVWSATWDVTDVVGGDTWVMFFGVSPTSMWRTEIPVVALGVCTIGPFNTTLGAGTKMYFRIVHYSGFAQVVGESGIYTDVLT